jgi:hypothetical protein
MGSDLVYGVIAITEVMCTLKKHQLNLWSHKNERVRDHDIRDHLGVAPIEEKLIQHRLRWFGHVQRRPLEAPVHCGVLSQVNNMRKGRERPKLTWRRQ